MRMRSQRTVTWTCPSLTVGHDMKLSASNDWLSMFPCVIIVSGPDYIIVVWECIPRSAIFFHKIKPFSDAPSRSNLHGPIGTIRTIRNPVKDWSSILPTPETFIPLFFIPPLMEIPTLPWEKSKQQMGTWDHFEALCNKTSWWPKICFFHNIWGGLGWLVDWLMLLGRLKPPTRRAMVNILGNEQSQNWFISFLKIRASDARLDQLQQVLTIARMMGILIIDSSNGGNPQTKSHK